MRSNIPGRGLGTLSISILSYIYIGFGTKTHLHNRFWKQVLCTRTGKSRIELGVLKLFKLSISNIVSLSQFSVLFALFVYLKTYLRSNLHVDIAF